MQSREPGVRPESEYYTYQPSSIARQLYLSPICVGHFYYEPGYYLRRNQYDSILLLYVRSGICKGRSKWLGDFTIEKDQFVIIDCYEPHEYGNGGDSVLDTIWLHFDGALARTYFDMIRSSHGQILTLSNTQPLIHHMDRLLSLFREKEPIRELAVSERITRMMNILLYADSKVKDESEASQGSIVEDALAYINEHYAEPVSLEQLAKNSSLSPYYFARIFSERTGYSPHQYLIATRIGSAKFLLQSRGMSVKEIAYSCGFGSESSFCSTFKKREGMTPVEFRRQALNT